MAKNSKAPVKKSRLSLTALEPRWVFDGALAVDSAVKLGSDAGLKLFEPAERVDTHQLLSQAQIDAQQRIASWMQQPNVSMAATG